MSDAILQMQLNHAIDKVNELQEELSHMKKAGACHACEAVGEENEKLRELLKDACRIIKYAPIKDHVFDKFLEYPEIKQLLSKGGE